jgi:hypothetical protein
VCSNVLTLTLSIVMVTSCDFVRKSSRNNEIRWGWFSQDIGSGCERDNSRPLSGEPFILTVGLSCWNAIGDFQSSKACSEGRVSGNKCLVLCIAVLRDCSIWILYELLVS